MKKDLTGYTLGETGSTVVNIFRDGKANGCGVLGVASALEAIFVMEKLTEEDWLIYEDGKVYLVDREEYSVSKEQEHESK